MERIGSFILPRGWLIWIVAQYLNQSGRSMKWGSRGELTFTAVMPIGREAAR